MELQQSVGLRLDSHGLHAGQQSCSKTLPDTKFKASHAAFGGGLAFLIVGGRSSEKDSNESFEWKKIIGCNPGSFGTNGSRQNRPDESRYCRFLHAYGPPFLIGAICVGGQ